ncbi:MAG: transposase [Burkholderia sp.]
MTIWINEAVLARIPDAIPTRGRPCLYGDALIQALLGVKTVYRLTWRALQGFTQSLRDLAFPGLPVPNYTTLCLRTALLHKSGIRISRLMQVTSNHSRNSSGPVVLMEGPSADAPAAELLHAWLFLQFPYARVPLIG